VVANERDVIWIRDLRVAKAFRCRGLGRQLVRAAESLGRELGVSEMLLLPLSHAVDFWHRMGYRAAPDMSRVLAKRLVPRPA
jgi:GNAT superfamily N-acetyltransferase